MQVTRLKISIFIISTLTKSDLVCSDAKLHEEKACDMGGVTWPCIVLRS
jgi:hypothetical protein